MHEIPLGKPAVYPQAYAPDVLFPVTRSDTRKWPGAAAKLPFQGEDIWNAWELSWLDETGKPVVATACIRIPVTSTNLIESKSLKLYLNSLANSRHECTLDLQRMLVKDLSAVVGTAVSVDIALASESTAAVIGEFSGTCIDALPLTSPPAGEPDARILTAKPEKVVSEELYSHLLRSNCPITNQPDSGSILLRYEGGQIDRQSLLKYIISYRNHNAFHEACVEQIFIDIKTRCAPARLTVYARYNRRGGLDINPFRSDYEKLPANIRLWRQ